MKAAPIKLKSIIATSQLFNGLRLLTTGMDMEYDAEG